MDFDKLYIAGKHQWDAMRDRSDEKDIYKMIRDGKAVYIKDRQKYFTYKDNVIPVISSERDERVNVIRTVLKNDMFVYEHNGYDED